MKRYMVLGIAGMFLLSCCGCAGIAMPKLTESEFDKVAEYAAYTLLKNTDGYESRLLSEEEVKRELEERKLAAEIEAALEAANRPGGSLGSVLPDTGGDASDDFHTDSKTLSYVLGLEGVEVEYAGHKFVSSYPDDSEALFGIKAPKGKKLMVLSFVLTNTGSGQAECDLLSKDGIYRITVGGKTYRSLLTSFDNDLSTWNTPVAPGSINMAFLVFQVPDELAETNIGSMEFSVRTDKTTRSIILR